MTFSKLSENQKKVFKWCYRNENKAIICDGAVRSGKTISMVTSFILWAMRKFNKCNFGICGKTIASAERNIVLPLFNIADIVNYFTLKHTKNRIYISDGKHENIFFIFGGKDESSYELLQGITLSGILLDEVALMPESFVNQAIARCLSVEDALYWFNCNPESPKHWFYQNWIKNPEEKNALYIHFTMEDNPILSQKQIAEAKKQFSGVFYDRYILGLWTNADGLIYPNYRDAIIDRLPDGNITEYGMSIDYGTLNAFAAILWYKIDGVWYAAKEYYYSGRDTGAQKTDEDYLKAVNEFTADMPDSLQTIIDPSAASFITLLRRQNGRYRVVPAINDVLDGIRDTAVCMQNGNIKILSSMKNFINEVEGYVWDSSQVEERPVKISDHCLTGDTLVETETGRVPIYKLVGNTGNVWSYNTETGKAELKPFHDVRMTQRNADIYEIELEDGRKIKCTGEHPVLTDRGYIQADRLKENCKVIDIHSIQGYLIVKSIRKSGKADVYNMEVDGNHNFAVNGGLIVHNCMDATRYFVRTKHLARRIEEYKPILGGW